MSQASSAIVTLLTDFGTRDPYVGICKGVILSRCPRATLVDLTHEVPQGDIQIAGYLLAGAWRYFPRGTVHVAVVDPGVGTARRVLAASVAGQFLIAPDNGLLSPLLDEAPPDRVVSVENTSLFLHPVSHTFHGRDIFAPVAAAIAGGLDLAALGPEKTSWLHLPSSSIGRDDDGALVGEVVYVDRFGNLVTNFLEADVAPAAAVTIAGHTIRRVDRTYACVDDGSLVALIGSTGRLEISVNRGDAAGMLGVGIGAEVLVRLPVSQTSADSGELP